VAFPLCAVRIFWGRVIGKCWPRHRAIEFRKFLRQIDRASIGTTITDPNINFAMVAKGMGVYSEGPITDPKDLGPAIQRAMEVVKRGEPALVDALTQPR